MSRIFAVTNNSESFWRFSIRWYQIPQVSSSLLKWQDQSCLNVNRVLMAWWLTAQRVNAIESLNIHQHQPALLNLENWITQLRRCRNHLKPMIEEAQQQENSENFTNLRKRILAIELRLERLHQRLLVNMLDQPLKIAVCCDNTTENLVSRLLANNLRQLLGPISSVIEHDIQRVFIDSGIKLLDPKLD